MNRSRSLSILFAFALTLLGVTANAQPLAAGNDCWVTNAGTQFEIEALPSGYFGTKAGVPSDARAAQVIAVTGNPLPSPFVVANCPSAIVYRTVWVDRHGTPVQPNDKHAVSQQQMAAGVEPIDTIVRRSTSTDLGGGPVTVPVEMIALSLRSATPITVTFGAQPASFFDVFITLDGVQPVGQMDLKRTGPGRGTTLLNSLPVRFKVDFQDTQQILPPRQIAGLSINFTDTQGNFAFITGVPTLSEWMLLLMALVLLSGSAVLIGSPRSAVSASGMQLSLPVRRLIFPSVYWPTLGVTAACLAAGWALGLFRGASAEDYFGAGANALALAYLIHLVIGRSRSPRP